MSETYVEPGKQTFHSRWESGALQFSRLAALFTTTIGLMVVAGWWLHLPLLTNPVPGQLPIALSTGFSFLACGLALLCVSAKKRVVMMHVFAAVLAMVPLFIGISIALFYLLVSPFDLDSLLIGLDLAPIGQLANGRMAPQSSIGFIAGAMAIILSHSNSRTLRYLSQALAISVFGLGLAVICGYTYGTPAIYSIGALPPVALLTGATFLVWGVGMFFARPDTGLAAVVTDTELGGKTARILLPVALLGPIALGYVRSYGQKLDWYAMPIDTSLMVLLLGACFSLIVLWHCHFLSRISRRERIAIDALQKNEARTRLIIDRAYDAFVAIDKGGLVIDWNLQAEKIFGWERHEIIGQKLSDCIIPLEFRRLHDEGFRHLLITGDGRLLNKRIQLVAQRRNGEQFPVELAVFPVEVDGQLTFCAFVQDITERKRIESQVELLNEQLVLARDQALEGSRLKSEFLANMSHEIRTPMNAVIGLSDLLRRTTLSKDQKRFVDLIVTSGQTLLQIIDDILVFSKIEAGRLDLEKNDFDLIGAVESAADLLADKAREKKVSLTTFLEPELPQRVRGDSQRLKQVLLNLMSNAIKFTDKGRILVRAELESITDSAVNVKFSVSDTGIGISEEGLKILFTPFTQVDGSTTRRHGGTGLGLTISKRLVELMGGNISVSSTEGKGSVFTFCIPFNHAQAAEFDRPAPVASLESVRLLMIGLPDHEATVVESYVESWGLRSSYATYAEEASLTIAHARREGDPYQAILVDSQVSDVDPYLYVKQLRETTSVSNTKILLLLSIDDIGQSEHAMQAGFDGTITRPIKQSSLFNCLLALFESRVINGSQHDTLELISTGEPPSGQFILVAEDNIVNQEVAVLLLHELGFNAHVVPNGKMALEASQDSNCQLILMDCQMPEMDGFEATRLIRQRERQTEEHIPIIAMTAHAMEGDRDLCIQSGMDDYVSKPVTINRLRDVVTRWLDYKVSHKSITFTNLPVIELSSLMGKDKDTSTKNKSIPAPASKDKDASTNKSIPAPADAVTQDQLETTPDIPDVAKYLKEIETLNQEAAAKEASLKEQSKKEDRRKDDTFNNDWSRDAYEIMITNTNNDLPIMSSEELLRIENEIEDEDVAYADATPDQVEIPASPTQDQREVSPITGNLTTGQIDMTPFDEEEDFSFEEDRRLLGLGRKRKLKERLMKPSEDMLDDALDSVSNEEVAMPGGKPEANKPINMSPQEAMSEVDTIMRNTAAKNEPSPMVTAARKQMRSTVNDIDVSNLIDYGILESTFGPQSAKKFLNLFASMTPTLLMRLENAIYSKQQDAAKAAAHELKGMCATIHISTMVDLCRSIEESTAESEWTEAEILLNDLKKTFNAAETTIKNL